MASVNKKRSQAKFKWSKLYRDKIVDNKSGKTIKEFIGFKSTNRKMVPTGSHTTKISQSVFDATDENLEKQFLEFDSAPFVLIDKRRASKYRAKIVHFGKNGIDVEPESLILQSITFDQFRSKSAELLRNLYIWWNSHWKSNILPRMMNKSIKYTDSDCKMKPILCTIYGYRGKYRIELDDSNYKKLAMIALVHDN